MDKYLHACNLALDPQTLAEVDPEGKRFSPRQREIIHDAFSRLKAKIEQGRVSESVLSSIFPGLE